MDVLAAYREVGSYRGAAERFYHPVGDQGAHVVVVNLERLLVRQPLTGSGTAPETKYLPASTLSLRVVCCRCAGPVQAASRCEQLADGKAMGSLCAT
jgi:hypothetical protein